MAYIYADLATIKQFHDYRVLVQLTNDDDDIDEEDAGLIDETVLQAHENSASRTMDNHFRNVYDNLPLTGGNLTAEVKEMAAHLTWCSLWGRRGDEPQQVTDLRKSVLERLKAMTKPDAEEVRGPRATNALAGRNSKGRARTMFERGTGYFDGLGIAGTRDLPQDVEGSDANQ